MFTVLQEKEVGAAAERSRLGVFARYFVLVVVAVLGGVGLLLAIGSSHWYMAHGSNPGFRLIGYSQWMDAQNCAVVLYGDSSALTGLDPAVVEARTGLKTCNVADGTVIQQVVGSDLPLDAYLRRNRTPRYVVGMWTPSIYLPYRRSFRDYSPEGVAYALNYMKPLAVLAGLMRRPSWILQFCSDLSRDLEKMAADWVHGRRPRDVREERIARAGQWMFPRGPETECVRTAMHYDPSKFDWDPEGARHFRERYTSAQTKVIVNVSPVPDCDTLYDVYAQRLAGWHDNEFERLPIRYFNDSDVHFSAEGSRYLSEKVAAQIAGAVKANLPE